MPRYFYVTDLFKEYQIEDEILFQHIENSSVFYTDWIEIFEILFKNNIKNIELLRTISKNIIDPLTAHQFESLIKLLASQKILDEEIVTQILDFKNFKKVFEGYIQLNDVNLLNRKTCSQIMVTDIENQVQKLTKPFPIKKSYLYFLRNYTSPIQWGLGLGFGLGISIVFCLQAGLKWLALSALSAHPLIGIALISLSAAFLFILGKACLEFSSHTKQTLCLSR